MASLCHNELIQIKWIIFVFIPIKTVTTIKFLHMSQLLRYCTTIQWLLACFKRVMRSSGHVQKFVVSSQCCLFQYIDHLSKYRDAFCKQNRVMKLPDLYNANSYTVNTLLHKWALIATNLITAKHLFAFHLKISKLDPSSSTLPDSSPLRCQYITQNWQEVMAKHGQSAITMTQNKYRADSRFASSQWETVLFCKVSHWLGASLESAQKCISEYSSHHSKGGQHIRNF